MRVTESRLIDMAQSGMAKANTQLGDASNEVSSGMRVSRPSDDPAAWAEGMRASVRSTISAGRGDAMGRAQDRLGATDGALDTVGRTLSRARELAVQMANGSLSSDERTAAVDEVNQLRETILAAGNSRDADGNYLLAGSKNNVAPFTPAGAYVGDTLTGTIETSDSGTSQVSIAGTTLTAATGVDVLGALTSLSSALTANDVMGVQSSLGTLGSGIAQVAKARTQVGTQLSTLASADASRKSFELNLASSHARAVEADPIAAASDLARAKQALESAQAVASQIIQLTKPQQ